VCQELDLGEVEIDSGDRWGWGLGSERGRDIGCSGLARSEDLQICLARRSVASCGATTFKIVV
jgi:hypothetical protein